MFPDQRPKCKQKADAGMGLIAGLAIAFIATTSDRITQAWLSRQPGASTFTRH